MYVTYEKKFCFIDVIYREEQLMNRTEWMTCVFLVSTINDLHQSVRQSNKIFIFNESCSDNIFVKEIKGRYQLFTRQKIGDKLECFQWSTLVWIPNENIRVTHAWKTCVEKRLETLSLSFVSTGEIIFKMASCVQTINSCQVSGSFFKQLTPF